MNLWDILAVLASGLLGAAIGALATLAALWWDRKGRREAAARAVWIEIAYNASIVGGLLGGQRGGWPSSVAYRTCLADLAALLSMNDLREIAAPYHALAGIEPVQLATAGNRDLLKGLQQSFTSAQATLTPYIDKGRF